MPDERRIEPPDAAGWRAWLEANGASSKGVWVAIRKKHAEAPGPTYQEAVEEALCFGWIDGTGRRLDERRFLQRFSPRKAGSIWAASNKRRVEALIEQGRMTAAGLAVVDRAHRDGSWHLLDEVDALNIPPDLSLALDAVPVAADHFDAYPDSAKRMALYWIASAKRAATRASRIEQVVAMAAENVRPARSARTPLTSTGARPSDIPDTRTTAPSAVSRAEWRF